MNGKKKGQKCAPRGSARNLRMRKRNSFWGPEGFFNHKEKKSNLWMAFTKLWMAFTKLWMGFTIVNGIHKIRIVNLSARPPDVQTRALWDSAVFSFNYNCSWNFNKNATRFRTNNGITEAIDYWRKFRREIVETAAIPRWFISLSRNKKMSQVVYENRGSLCCN